MANVSHGRGGAGNIEPDSQPYTDAGIVREGVQGDQGDGAFSTGRGGAGNVGSPHVKPSDKPHGEDVIPEVALRDDSMKDYHVGRGGAGNEHHDHSKGDHHDHSKGEHHDHPKGEHEHETLVDKLKHKVTGKN